MKIRNPKEVFQFLIQKCTPAMKFAFIAVFLVGFFCHFIIFTGDFPNHDGLESIYSAQNMIGSGRWFLSIACGISSYFTLPWIIGLLSLFYLALTAVLLVDLLQINSKLVGFFTGALLVSFPALTATFAYMFTADGYLLSLFLAVLSVYVTKHYRYGFVPAGLLLAASMGGYQAYVSVAMVLSLVLVYQIILVETVSLVHKIKKIASYAAMGGIGITLYALIQKAAQFIFSVELNQYQGISDVGNTASYSLLDKIYLSYYDFLSFTLKQKVFMGNWFVLCLYVLLFLLCVLHFMKRHRILLKSPLFYFLTLGTLCILPLVMNAILFITPNVNYHTIMRYHWILIPIIMVAYLDQMDIAVGQWLLFIITTFLILSYGLTDNISYSNLEKKYEKTYGYCLRLVDRMEQTEGYYQGIPVMMIGIVSENSYPDTDITRDVTQNIIGISGTSLLYQGKNYQAFLKHYLNVTIHLVEDEKQILELYDSEEYQNLNSFPAKDSMKVVDGILLIKTE